MNKKMLNILFICLIGLFLISSVNAADDLQANSTVASNDNSNYQITSDLSNDNIQSMFDNAKDGDTFEFTDKEYKNISLVVDKKLNIISNEKSVVYADNHISSKAQSLGITNTFGFYFTSNSGGSILSGITIIPSNCDYGIVVDSSDKTVIKNNHVTGGKNAVLIKNSNGVNLINNDISKASVNGVQLHDATSCVISQNTITYNGKSGIETSNINNCIISNNTVHHNGFNGISMYGTSTKTTIKYNNVHDNDNGIFINTTSSYDVIKANSFSNNWIDNFNSEIGGGSETGNGLLFGSGFKTSREGTSSRLVFEYNTLVHNQNYQAKNNPELSRFKLGDNWYDSTDGGNSFVCPFLLSGILRIDTISVKNGIGLQMYDSKGNAVQEFGTFDTTVNIDGNQYTAKFVNGRAVIDADLDPNKEYDLEVMVGGQPVKYKYKAASGESGKEQDSSNSQNSNGERGASGSSSKVSTGTNSGISKGSGAQEGNSKSAHYANSDQSGVYGTNASGDFRDSSDNGLDAQTNGDANSGDSSEGEVSEEGKAYEIVPPSKISKEINDTSGIVVLAVVFLLGCLVYGYRRHLKFDE